MNDGLVLARELADEFRASAAARDRAAGTPTAERDRLRSSGLLKLSIPTEHGGEGGTWPELLGIVRTFAAADASLAHVFAYHHLGVVTPHLVGTPAQRDQWYTETARHNLFWGNSLNPLDPRTTLTRVNDQKFVLNGDKSFCTGGRGSDVLLVSATEPGQAQLRIAVLPTDRSGITVKDDWDNMGQRQTDSGSISYREVEVYPHELLGPPGVGGSVWASLRSCITQAILTTIYIGLAEGAFQEACPYTLSLERPFAGSTAARASDDPYVLERYGRMHVQIASAVALLERAAAELQRAWECGPDLESDERGACAVAIAAARIAGSQCALDVTSQVFEVMGARATSARYSFDRFWRNARTLTLHDPVDYKIREMGDWVLNGRFPTPSIYS